MAITTERRIAKLEQEIKALKATYSIYGGMMRTYTTSGHFYQTEATRNFVVRFTPQYATGKNTILASLLVKYTRQGVEDIFDDGYVSIQDGSGELLIHCGWVFDNSDVYIQIATTVPGTLTKVS